MPRSWHSVGTGRVLRLPRTDFKYMYILHIQARGFPIPIAYFSHGTTFGKGYRVFIHPGLTTDLPLAGVLPASGKPVRLISIPWAHLRVLTFLKIKKLEQV